MFKLFAGGVIPVHVDIINEQITINETFNDSCSITVIRELDFYHKYCDHSIYHRITPHGVELQLQ